MKYNTITTVPQHTNNINIDVSNYLRYINYLPKLQEQKKENENLNPPKEFNDSDLLNYKINRYNSISNKKSTRNNYTFNRPNNNISFFQKPKNNYYEFNPNPDVEEIPTFTFENDKNLNNYKDNIYSKEAIIEQNSKNYMSYMKKFERRKTPIRTPYAVFQEITKNNLNNYSKINNNKNNSNNNNKIANYSVDNNINNNTTEWNENYSNSYVHGSNLNNLKEMKPLSTSMSAKAIVFDNRKTEISNPDLFYKRNNDDYFKYRAEQKKYLDYNYKILMNKNKLHDKQEPNINPYNPKYDDFEHYKSNLAHNPILNPVNYYSYNKYLEKEIKNNKRYENNDINGINNYSNINNNNRNYSPLHNAGNQIFNK